MNQELYKKVIERFLRFKDLMLLAEEVDPEGNVSLQPYMEMYRGIDHFVRVEAARLGINDAPTDNSFYEEENLRKAKGHFYRAAFDVLDWLSINLRDSIRNRVEPYDTETINAVVPEYYKEIKPDIVNLCDRIAQVRAQKDVGIEDEIVNLVEEYENIILELKEKLKLITSKVPALAAYQKKRKKEYTRERIRTFCWQFGAGVLVGIVIMLLQHKFFP